MPTILPLSVTSLTPASLAVTLSSVTTRRGPLADFLTILVTTTLLVMSSSLLLSPVAPLPGTPGKGLVPSPESLGKGVAMDSFVDSIAAVVLSFFKVATELMSINFFYRATDFCSIQ